jgi:hypothetical protein
MRVGEEPNLRAQDGWKPRMLCGDCEQKFGLLEKRFADNCFYPIINGEKVRFVMGLEKVWCQVLQSSGKENGSE